jgi:hypothetical protein
MITFIYKPKRSKPIPIPKKNKYYEICNDIIVEDNYEIEKDKNDKSKNYLIGVFIINI